MKSLWCCLALLSLAACAGYIDLGRIPDDMDGKRRDVVRTAVAQIGAPYRYEGADRRGFDDAGLVHFAYQQADVDMPRYTENQRQAGTTLGFGEARPGDLLFYRVRTGASSNPTLHVGLYVGNGDMVHSIVDRDEVTLEPVDNDYWRNRFVTAVTLPALDTKKAP